MKKIREIIESEVQQKDDIPGYVVSLSEFMISFSALMVYLAHEMAIQPVPHLSLGKETFYGDAREGTFEDCLAVLNGSDFYRSFQLSLAAREFLQWLLDQDEPDSWNEKSEDYTYSWCDITFLAEKWNKFTEEKNK